MKYNVYSVMNSAYYKFGTILINSIKKNCDLNNIEKIYILSTGMSDSQLIEIDKLVPGKLVIIKARQDGKILDTSSFGGVWGREWHLNICIKTPGLHKILFETKTPTVMIDADCMVVKDIHDLLLEGGDIQVCFRPLHRVPYLASYFAALDVEKSIIFIRRWMSAIEDAYNNNKNNSPKESPALSATILGDSGINIVRHEVDKVSQYYCVNFNKGNETVMYGTIRSNEIYIFHFKGTRQYKDADENFRVRIIDKGFYDAVKEYLCADLE